VDASRTRLARTVPACQQSRIFSTSGMVTAHDADTVMPPPRE